MRESVKDKNQKTVEVRDYYPSCKWKAGDSIEEKKDTEERMRKNETQKAEKAMQVGIIEEMALTETKAINASKQIPTLHDEETELMKIIDAEITNYHENGDINPTQMQNLKDLLEEEWPKEAYTVSSLEKGGIIQAFKENYMVIAIGDKISERHPLIKKLSE